MCEINCNRIIMLCWVRTKHPRTLWHIITLWWEMWHAVWVNKAAEAVEEDEEEPCELFTIASLLRVMMPSLIPSSCCCCWCCFQGCYVQFAPILWQKRRLASFRRSDALGTREFVSTRLHIGPLSAVVLFSRSCCALGHPLSGKRLHACPVS